MKYKYILAIDPSGSFYEGKGTTGWVFIDSKEKLLAEGTISAKHFNCPEEYYDAHTKLIDRFYEKHKNNMIVVIEDYILYRNKSKSQINSRMETPKLIGILQWHCWKITQDYSMQLASQVKHRWSDDVLFRDKILTKRNKKLIHKQTGKLMNSPHIRDALRHALHYAITRNFNKKKYNHKTYKTKYNY